VEVARRRGHPVRWAVATEAARPIAFGALAHLLPAAPPVSASRLSLLQRALATLAELGGEDRLLLGVDDAHLLDDSSSVLIHLAATAANVLVVATTRADAGAPGPVTALWKEGLAERIELLPLTRQAVIELTTEVLGGGLDHRTAHLLWRATLGNPLYLRELLLAGLDARQLMHAEGVWRWRGALRVGSRLAEVVRGRLGDLGSGLREALEMLAVAQRLELSLVEQLCGEDLLREAEGKGVVTTVREGRRDEVEFAHPLYAEVLRQGIPQHRVERIMGRLAAALEGTGARRRGDLLRSCDWRLQAGLPVPDGLLLASATEARETGDWRLAERLLGPISRDGAPNGARLVLGDALYSAGRWAEAEVVMNELDVSALPESAAADVTTMRIDNLALHLGRVTEAERLLDRLGGAPPGPRWLPYCRAQLALLCGDVASALTSLPARPPVEVNGAGGATWSVVASLSLARAAAMSGDLERALRVLDQVLLGPEEETVYSVRRSAFADRLGYAVMGGYFEQVPIDSIYAAAVSGGDRLGQWFIACLAGLVVLASGDATAARRWAAELAGNTPPGTDGAALAAAHSVRARLLALVGETDRAAAALAEMEAARRPEIGYYDSGLAAARCAVAAARGDPELAQSLALEAADRALELGQNGAVVVHCHDAARYGQVAAAAERSERVSGTMTGPLLPVVAGQVLAWSRSDAEGLDTVSRAYADLGAYLLAAEAALTATRLHQEAGRRTAAALSAAWAAGLVERCAGCHTPVLDGGW
jgi:tetratricopeptide (TPR) repeat protein